MYRFLLWISLGLLMVYLVGAPPVDPKKKDKKDGKDSEDKEGNDIDDFGLEYGRYLQQVVQALEEDKDFAKKLENVSAEQIKSGDVAKELEFVKHNVRTKLDELKRIELERLRKLSIEEMERNELGLYRDEEGHLAPPSNDGRRWRTISTNGGGVDRKNAKMPHHHVDFANRHTFEIEDLRKLMKAATKDLEELDKRRREEFKQYEMEKEHQYRESLKNMTEDERKEAVDKHEELIKKHKDHPKIHHPGSKQQLEQVWEEQDHMQGNEFDPRVFFAMHDVNGDGYLDEQEVEAILSLEVRKMYDPQKGEDDPVEMMEEYNRMREHVYKETDSNKDGLISKQEFMDMTKKADFEQDDGWKGLDEQQIYTEEDLKEYEKKRQEHLQKMREAQYYQNVHGAVPLQQQHGVPMPQYQGVPQQHHQGGPQYQGVPPQHHQGGPQYQGVPPQHHQGVPQYQGVPPQHHQGGPQYQGVPPQHHQGVPPQHHQGGPQYQGVPPQHQGGPHSQQYQEVPHQQGMHPQQSHQQQKQLPPGQYGIPNNQGMPQHVQFQDGTPQQHHQAPQYQAAQAIQHPNAVPQGNAQVLPSHVPGAAIPSQSTHNVSPQQQINQKQPNQQIPTQADQSAGQRNQ